MNAGDFGPVAGANDCDRCGLEIWGCVCDPARPYRQPTPEEIELAREERLSRLERTNGGTTREA